jgi:hypothetical protein
LRARAQPGIDVQSHNVAPISRFTEERQVEEWVDCIGAHGRRSSVDRFPFQLKETAETPEGFSDIHSMSFAGSGSPERRHSNGLGGQADRGHGAKTDGARYYRIAAVEGELASAVRGGHPDVFQHLLHAVVQLEIRTTLGFAQF